MDHMKRRTFIGAMTVGTLGAAGVAVREMIGPTSRSVLAARRPTPTPKPVKCYGGHINVGGVCICPVGTEECGPSCCPAGTVCCDNACCHGECVGEEICIEA